MSGGAFSDKRFPATTASLVDSSCAFPTDWKDIQWLRAADIEIFKDGPLKVFEGKIEPDDIKQGGLGDCYYLCVLAAIAENKERIEKLIDLEKTNDSGIWAVNLFKNGVKQQVIMDDFIPCRDG